VANVKEVMDNALNRIRISSDAYREGRKNYKIFVETETVRRSIFDMMGVVCSPGCVTVFWYKTWSHTRIDCVLLSPSEFGICGGKLIVQIDG
jgi:hypothetical protein